MVEGVSQLDRIASSVESDAMNVEKYTKQMALTMREVTAAIGRMFEQEPWRVTALISASGGIGGGPKRERQVRGVMEHRVIQGW